MSGVRAEQTCAETKLLLFTMVQWYNGTKLDVNFRRGDSKKDGYCAPM
jgi:hypothetical protein